MKKSNKSLEDRIEDIFRKNPNKEYTLKQLSGIIGEKNSKSKTLIFTISKLLENKIIEQTHKDTYQIKRKQKVITGKIDFSEKGYPFIISSDQNQKVYISTKNLNHSIHGDIVEVSLLAQSKKYDIEGEVIKILERGTTSFVGTVAKSENFAFLIADNKTMPYDIFIPLKKLKKAKHGDKVIVRITDWPEYAKNPIGEVIEILGRAGDNDVEMNSILLEFGLPHKFPEDIEKEAEKIPIEIPKEEIKRRKDFRDVFTITIDPFDAKDFDDAISLNILNDDLYQIGIHIADVSHYVQENSPIDKEALNRATSVYLVDRVIPMLPEKLSNNVCSLNENTDKLTFSVVIDIDKKAKIKKYWIGKTIINSNKRFNYDEVQQIIENKEGLYYKEILILNDLAQKIRKERYDNGAISFDRGELKFIVNDKGQPIEVLYQKQKEANQLIEEFMLIANKIVAESIGKKAEENQKIKPFVYRIHESPDFDKLKQFQNFIQNLGYKFSLKNEKAIAQSLNKLFVDIQQRPEAEVIYTFAIRAMARAEYSTNNIGHFGLNFKYYTHFTSPIRRYPDLIVHRLLYKYFNNNHSSDVKILEPLCKHSSQMEQMAMNAERASLKYKAVEFMKNRIGQIFEGYISGLNDWGMFVEIIPFKIEGTILLRDITDDFFYFDEDNFCLKTHYTQKTYRIGDKVNVKVVRADLQKRQLDFELLKKSN